MVGTYARRMAEAGYRGAGVRPPRLRRERRPAPARGHGGKLADLRAAVGHLAAHPAVDRGAGRAAGRSAWAAATRCGRRPSIPGCGRWPGWPAATTARPRSPRSMGTEAYRAVLARFVDSGDPDARGRGRRSGGDGRARAVGVLRHRAVGEPALGERGDRGVAVLADDPRRPVVGRPPGAHAAARRPRHARRLLQSRPAPRHCSTGRPGRRRSSGSRPPTTSSSTTRRRTSDQAMAALVPFFERELAPRPP